MSCMLGIGPVYPVNDSCQCKPNEDRCTFTSLRKLQVQDMHMPTKLGRVRWMICRWAARNWSKNTKRGVSTSGVRHGRVSSD